MKLFKSILLILAAISVLNAQNFLPYNSESNNLKPPKLTNFQDYKKMIDYFKQAKDAKSYFSLGTIYLNGIEENGKIIISPDPVLAEKYFRLAADKGYKNADIILAGLYVFNKNMRSLDKNLTKAESILKNKTGSDEAKLLLASLYIMKDEHKKALPILMEEANKGRAEAQFTLAVIFKKGHRGKDGNFDIMPDEKAALYFLNKACLNENKPESIRKICYDPRYVIMEKRKEKESEE